MNVSSVLNTTRSQKPASQRKPPIIRQTLTSKYRLLKANPQLVNELTKKVSPEGLTLKPLKTLAAVMDDDKPPADSKSLIKAKAVCSKSINKHKFITHQKPSTQLLDKHTQPLITPFKTPTMRVQASSRPASISTTDLSAKLSQWLNKKGKSLKDYQHLKCFDLKSAEAAEADKENTRAMIAMNVTRPTESDKSVQLPVTADLENIATEALTDLYKLILEGYPAEQCEVWLKLIKQKYAHLEKESRYWECRAALEQSKGNISSAVEHCKTAIIQGAEVHTVDAFLDQLLQKFSLLNINNEQKQSKEREKIIKEAKNVFKSSIIQFAVQEKILKKKTKDGVTVEKSVVVTPVRRSTRLSRSAYSRTPGIQICSSLNELDCSLKENLEFKNNFALFD